MRVHKIVCPKCSSALTSKAGVEEGAPIGCPKCSHKFKAAAEVIAAAEEDFEYVEEEEAPAKPVPRPAVKRVIEADDEDDEEEDDRPKPKKRRPVDDDEDSVDDRPKAKKRPRDADDDDRPRKKKKKKRKEQSAYSKIKDNIWIRASVLGVLLITLAVVAWLRWGRDKPAENSDSSSDTSKEADSDADLGKPIVLPKTNPKKDVTKKDGGTNNTIPTSGSPTRLLPLQQASFDTAGQLIFERPVKLSANGKRVAVSLASDEGGGKTQVWEIVPAPRKINEFNGRALALSPSGNRLFTDASPAVFDVESKDRVAEAPIVAPSFAEFLDEDMLLATFRSAATDALAEGKITLWNVAMNADAGSFDIPDSRFIDAATTRGGKEIWLFMPGRCEVECWDIQGKSFIRKITPPKPRETKKFGIGSAVTDDGSIFTYFDDASAAFFDGRTGAQIAKLPAFSVPIMAGFVPGTSLYVGMSGKGGAQAGLRPMDLVVFDARTQAPLAALSGRVQQQTFPHVAISADRKSVVVVTNDGKASLYDIAKVNSGATAKTPKNENRAPDADQQRIQGEWKVALMNINGEVAPADTIADLKWTFNGQSAKNPLENSDWQFKLDASKSPAQVDFTDGSGKMSQGIYRFTNADTIEICYPFLPDSPRPKDFKADVESNLILFAIKRAN